VTASGRQRRIEVILAGLQAKLPFIASNGAIITDLRQEGGMLVTVFANGKTVETPLAALLACDAAVPISLE